jgi:asparagine synthase (glutamine-hydrolysing)
MCGIAGIWRFKDVLPKDTLVRFTDSLSHRGPDGAGYELLHQDALGFGHRRLSILDLSEAGKQPMTCANGRFWMVFNGEVFNFLTLRAELIAKGYKFQSNTDSEVILAAYQEWGAACLHRFNGMWALAIWDEHKNELFLARDRFGIKPLYYHFNKHQGFSFSSETRSFKFLNGFNRTISERLLQLSYENEYALEGLGYTIFDDIFQLLPGHYITVKKGDSIVQQRRWWSIEDRKIGIPMDITDRIAKFDELFEDSCKLRLQSDVPLATALSGGLDSTSVYAKVSKLLNHGGLDRVNANSQSAFTAVFPGLRNDETSYAEEAAQYLNQTINKVEIPDANIVSVLKKDTEIADYIGRPISSITAVKTKNPNKIQTKAKQLTKKNYKTQRNTKKHPKKSRKKRKKKKKNNRKT